MSGVGGTDAFGAAPRVLIVDDDEHVLDFVAMALSEEGFDVQTAANGALALERIDEHWPNVIILDLWMPVMDGWTFLREYRRRPGPRAPVIALTAAQYDPSQSAAIEAEGFLPKPFSLDALIGLVSLYTGHPTAAGVE
jgi:DNA-binding response OmpR family regulator